MGTHSRWALVGSVLGLCACPIVRPRTEWVQKHLPAIVAAERARLTGLTAAAVAHTREAEALEAKGDLPAALARYQAALSALPVPPPRALSVRLVGLAISAARRIGKAPTTPEAAERFALRGAALVKLAQDEAGYERAMGEFWRAITFAPWWADLYYNVAVIAEKAGRTDITLEALRAYLQAKPDAADGPAIKRKIIELEVILETRPPVARLAGIWHDAWRAAFYRINVSGTKIGIALLRPGLGIEEDGWRAGDVRLYGGFEGGTFKGTLYSKGTCAHPPAPVTSFEWKGDQLAVRAQVVTGPPCNHSMTATWFMTRVRVAP